jgi:hypothetical protein
VSAGAPHTLHNASMLTDISLGDLAVACSCTSLGKSSRVKDKGILPESNRLLMLFIMSEDAVFSSQSESSGFICFLKNEQD